MNEERFFTAREITAFVVMVVLVTAVGISSYRTGLNLSGGQGAAGMAAASGPAPVNGQALYAGNCAGCHGAGATGGIGPALKVTSGWTTPQFASAVLHGNIPEGRTLSPVMPRFAEAGFDGQPPTDEQLSAVHDYLKSLP
ncbi:cytochrome c, class I [Deinococcus irradiatisoli]|uniref:Cytochrome c, class I n=1 Tax=Deinococcus irradiatisoli TaxID=2202254 RepID=A0A2Z3JNF2_9DEIO|nr:cytochrome c [Deinococcus irradiatisoli]AWN24309.1 cytochrome c, class I [Deinococcus irradiatisoli]